MPNREAPKRARRNLKIPGTCEQGTMAVPLRYGAHLPARVSVRDSKAVIRAHVDMGWMQGFQRSWLKVGWRDLVLILQLLLGAFLSAYFYIDRQLKYNSVLARDQAEGAFSLYMYHCFASTGRLFPQELPGSQILALSERRGMEEWY
ncbi:predicted protein [Histoplasma capsulatum H143]|uniref:Uncharacterized protein n=1 Tax=Ajellomyces capsulatus (strain H143) TaxID=544712 RepID=C6HI65_AJECH|nr:predicted protein [Histoplasma capsulatum H143]